MSMQEQLADASPSVGRRGMRLLFLDPVSRAYRKVVICRRLLRAICLATLIGLLFVPGYIAVLAVTVDSPETARAAWMLVPVIVVIGALLLTAQIWVLSAIVTGSRRIAVSLIVCCAFYVALQGAFDVKTIVDLHPRLNEQAASVVALLLTLKLVELIVGGLIEIARSDDLHLHLYREPIVQSRRSRVWMMVLGVPGVTQFARRRSAGAWVLLILAILVEGSALYLVVHYPDSLRNAGVRALESQAVAEPVGSAVRLPLTALSLALGVGVWVWILGMGARAGTWLRRAARRLVLETAAETLQADKRAPILFLRGFYDEDISLRGAPLPWRMRMLDPGAHYVTMEEMLVFETDHLGPLIAVANPWRPDAVVGASRFTLSDDSWKTVVAEQIGRARAVVVGLSASGGLQWEVGALLEASALSKTTFMFPPENSGDWDLLRRVCQKLDVDTSSLPAEGETPFQLVALSFDRDERALLFGSHELTESDYIMALRVAALESALSADDTLVSTP
jgi:hypothetical protein